MCFGLSLWVTQAVWLVPSLPLSVGSVEPQATRSLLASLVGLPRELGKVPVPHSRPGCLGWQCTLDFM